MICGPGRGRTVTGEEEGKEVPLMRKKKQKLLVRRKMYCQGRGRITTVEEEGEEVPSAKKKKRKKLLVERKMCGWRKGLGGNVAGEVKVVWPVNRKEIGQ